MCMCGVLLVRWSVLTSIRHAAGTQTHDHFALVAKFTLVSSNTHTDERTHTHERSVRLLADDFLAGPLRLSVPDGDVDAEVADADAVAVDVAAADVE